ncbi:MAG: CinA family protein [Gemmatimonadota bacterium]|nr:CinA family protein [Gemmatimonadota bacterium]
MTQEPGVADYRSIPELVQHLSSATRERGLKIATAESCTGGMVGAAITDQPGASACYVGGAVAYSDDVKVRCLNVDPIVIGAHGAVSKLVALQMAFGARRRFSADVALAVTGIAGPRGGSPGKPVGTVWIAVALSDGIGTARRMQFVGGRAAIRDRSVAAVLRLASEAIATHDL